MCTEIVNKIAHKIINSSDFFALQPGVSVISSVGSYSSILFCGPVMLEGLTKRKKETLCKKSLWLSGSNSGFYTFAPYQEVY